MAHTNLNRGHETFTKSRAFSLKTFLICLQLFMAGVSFGAIDVKTDDVTCNGKKDGKATITVTGATGNFRYSIDGASFQASNVFSNLDAGNYTATVKDIDTKCQFTKAFTIKEPTKLSVSVSGGGTFNFCRDQGPPKITLTASASGGTPPLTYNWPGGVLVVSASGTYTAEVTDKNGCKESSSVQVVVIPVVCSRDPNDIVGPDGVGAKKWVAKKDVLPYTIHFENDPKAATAAAQVVRVNQVLDPHVNIYTFNLGSFGFAGMVFPIPPNKTYYTALLDVRDSLGIYVDVIAGIDVSKNEAFWIFKSIDPLTGLPPDDASKGFLPVDDSITHKGEGFVSYRIKPKSTAITGDSIYAIANIVFDVNESILTPKIFNVIDALPPGSTIDSIPAVIDSTFSITVAAQDENGQGSGVALYDLYLSENAAGFIALAKNIPVDSAYLFRGDPGKNYCLYSLAKDSVGNSEAAKTSGYTCFSLPGEATIRILGPLGSNTYCAGDTIAIKWEAAGVDSLKLEFSANGGSSFYTVAAAVPASDSSYLWATPDTLHTGINYVIRISAVNNAALKDLSDGFTINKAAPPVISSSAGAIVCNGDSTLLDAGAGYIAYGWSTGATTQSIYTNTSGTYIVKVRDMNSCLASDSIHITIHPALPKPAITLSGPATFCFGGNVILTAADSSTRYAWSTGELTKSIVISYTGKFSLTTLDSSGCTSPASDSVSITVNALPDKPEISTNGANIICAGDTLYLYGPGGYARYQWSTGDSTSSIAVNHAGVFTLSVVNANNCLSPAADSVHVYVLPPPVQPVIAANGPLTFCSGDSVLLSVSSAYGTYQWSNGATSQSITVVNPGKYTVAVSDTLSCGYSVSDTVIVTLIAPTIKPTITASGPLVFCPGDSVVLSASSGYTAYLWSNGAITQSITVGSSGSYSVQGMTACGSAVSDTVVIVVTPNPVKPLVTASGPSTFCQGDSVTLTSSSGYTSYLWSNGTTAPTIVVSSSGSYYVQASNNCGTSSSDTVTVVVLPHPVQPIITTSGPATFCQGDSLILTSSAAYISYLWSNNAGTQSITVNSSGSYFVTGTSACGSAGSDTITVIVIPPPAKPLITAGGPLTFCQGDSLVLTSSTAYTSYLWSNSAGTQSITVNSSGSYFVTGTTACGSASSDTVTVIVLPPPLKPIVTASGPTTFCQGNSVSLTSSTGYTSYLWSNGATTQSITVSSSGSYTVKGTTACGFAVSDTVVIVVTPNPVQPIVSASGPTTFCQGTSITLTSSTGYTSYLWSNGATTQSITVNSSGSYTVKGITVCGLAVSDPVTVVVTPNPLKPIINAGGPLTFCQGGSVTLTASSGYTSYLWSNGATTQAIIVNSSGSYTVKGTTACGFAVSDPVSVVVLPNTLKPIVTASGPLTFCQGGHITLTASSGYTSYHWSTGATTQSITVSTSGTYSVSGTGTCGSVNSDPVTVTVQTTPVKPTISAGGPLTFCDGNTVVLTASSGYNAYTWSTGELTQSIVVSTTGNYKVKGSNTCGTSAYSNTTHVDVNALPAKPTITASGPTTFCQGGSVTLKSSNGTSYLWSNGATTKNISVNISGVYTVQVTNANGCLSPPSNPITVNVTNPSISVYAGQDQTLYALTPGSACATLTASITGAAVYQVKWSTGATTNSITVCPNSSKAYTVTATDANGCQVTDEVHVCVKTILCGNANNLKVYVCYNNTTLCVPLVNLFTYLGNGAQLGQCDDGFCNNSVVSKSTEDSVLNNLSAIYHTLEEMQAHYSFDAFPNPFNTSATVQFTLPETGGAKVQLYDATGKEIAVLYSAIADADHTYQFIVDAEALGLKQGLYFCKLSTEKGKVQYKKLVLTK